MFHPFASGFGWPGTWGHLLRGNTRPERQAPTVPRRVLADSLPSRAHQHDRVLSGGNRGHRANLEVPELSKAGAKQTEDVTPSLCSLIQAVILHPHAQGYQIESEGAARRTNYAFSPFPDNHAK